MNGHFPFRWLAIIELGLSMLANEADEATVEWQCLAPEQWKPLAQPQLAQDFAKAQPAPTEDICDGPDMCYLDTGPRYWIPNRDGKSWDAVLLIDPVKRTRQVLGSTMDVHTMTLIDDKNTSYTPPRGKLFVFDTTIRQIIHALEADFWWTPGYVTEALPGLVMGYAAPSNDASAQGGVLYGFDPAAGKMLWSKPVPHRPETARSMMANRPCAVIGERSSLWCHKVILTCVYHENHY